MPLFDKSTVEETPRMPIFYSHQFFVPKATGGFRLVSDLSVLKFHSTITSLYGNCPDSSGSCTMPQLDGVGEGHLPTSSCSIPKPTVSSLWVGGLCAPVLGTVLQTIYTPSGVHQDHGPSFCRVHS